MFIYKNMNKQKLSGMIFNFRLLNIIKSVLVISLPVLIIYGVVQAGSLTPTADPAATSYTLEDIYGRLTTNTAATVAKSYPGHHHRAGGFFLYPHSAV